MKLSIPTAVRHCQGDLLVLTCIPKLYSCQSKFVTASYMYMGYAIAGGDRDPVKVTYELT